MDEALERATTVLGSPRFFPPGAHPATARLRLQRDRLLELPETPVRGDILAYIDDRLAAFEEAESIQKAIYLSRRP